MVFWKIFQKRKIFILLFFRHFLIFFALWTPKRHKTWNETWKSSLLQKEVFMQKVLNLLQKFNKCCKKIFQQFFGTWFISKFFLDVLSTCSKEKPQKTWAINEKFSKDSIFMGKHGWHPLKNKNDTRFSTIYSLRKKVYTILQNHQYIHYWSE